MLTYQNLAEMRDDVQRCLTPGPSGVAIGDERLLREQVIERLAFSVNLGSDEVKSAAQWVIWEASQRLGAVAASIDELYRARARGEWDEATVPAMNLRGLTYDVARAAFRAALRNRVGAFIFEIARSEIDYTRQPPAEYASSLLAAAVREGFRGPVFIQGDHFQANARKLAQDPQGEMQALQRLIRQAIAAGFYNVDVDTSTLVDLSQPTVDEQQRTNYTRAAELSCLIREVQPRGVTVSVGGEIGEVGGKNSTIDELRAFMDGYRRELERQCGAAWGLSKISIQTGTSHGGVVLPDGTIAQVKLDFETLARLSRAAREEYGLGGAVQHGASTLPLEAFDRFVKAGCLEVHLATEFQNRMLASRAFPADLKREIDEYLREHAASERKPGETDEQFFYKTRKKAHGPFKARLWNLAATTRAELGLELERTFEAMFQHLGVFDTRDLVDAKVPLVRVSRPVPRGLLAS